MRPMSDPGPVQVVRFFYSLLLTLLLPVFLLRMWWRGRVNPAYRQRLGERFGLLRQHPVPGGIWIHAVSVGETLAALPLIRALQRQHPDIPLLITTTTPTGSEQVRRLLGDSVWHQYLPWDLPWLLGPFLRTLQPSLLVIMETELWPNLIAGCQQRSIPVMLANARLSARSARGYQKFAALTAPMLAGLDCVACQNSTDGQRFRELGLTEQQLQITGSIKFDVAVSPDLLAEAAALRQQWGSERRVLTLASSHAGEDEALLERLPTWQQQFPDLLLMLVPRHPERFEVVVNTARSAGFRVERRTTANPAGLAQAEVYVADTMGEMMRLLAASDLVVMGGSLFDIGGHNPIEPAALGKPVLMGPYGFNFADIVRDLQADGALQLTSLDRLAADVGRLLADAGAREQMGECGQQAVDRSRGAVDRMLALAMGLRKAR